MTDGNPPSVEARNAFGAGIDRCEEGQSAFTGAFLGCLTTLSFGAVGIVPGIASALATALLSGLLLATRATRLVAASFFTALYGGTFCGMTPVHWLSDGAAGHSGPLPIALLICLSIVCSLALLAVTMLDARSVAAILSGYGGRLGAIAAVASFFLLQLACLSNDASAYSAALTAASFISLSIACGFVFMFIAVLDARSTAPIGSGYGGRLGAIAAVPSFFFVQLLALLGVDSAHFHAPAGVLGVEPGAMALWFFACLVGTIGTLVVLRQQFAAFTGTAEKILVASVLALICLAALDSVSHRDAHTLGAFYAGCFLGMSTPDRVKGWAEPVLGAFVLNAVLVVVDCYLPGVGGSLGLAAFVTVALLVTAGRAISLATRTVLTRNETLAVADPSNGSPG